MSPKPVYLTNIETNETKYFKTMVEAEEYYMKTHNKEVSCKRIRRQIDSGKSLEGYTVTSTNPKLIVVPKATVDDPLSLALPINKLVDKLVDKLEINDKNVEEEVEDNNEYNQNKNVEEEVEENNEGNDDLVEIRDSDGYINATKLCKAGGKEWSNYNENKLTREYIKELSKKFNINVNEIVKTKKGGNHQGTWIHYSLAIHLAMWISPTIGFNVTEFINNKYPVNKTVCVQNKSLIALIGDMKIAEIRQSDGYINATAMCKAGNKFWADYDRLTSTKAYINELCAYMGIPIMNLVKCTVGGDHSGTWIHYRLAMDLARWISPKFAVQVDKLVIRYLSGQVTTEESINASKKLKNVVTYINDNNVTSDYDWNKDFEYDIRDINKKGIYLNLMHGLNIDIEPNTYIVAKYGKAVEQSIAKRNESHTALHTNNRLLFAKHTSDPSNAERKFRAFSQQYKWHYKGKYPDGRNGNEFIAFLPEDAPKVVECLRLACEDDEKQEKQEKPKEISNKHNIISLTAQYDHEYRMAQEKTKQMQLILEHLDKHPELIKLLNI